MTIIAASPYARHAVPVAELLDVVLDLLTSGPRTMAELTALTGYTNKALRPRLMQLIDDGLAHRQRRPTITCYKYLYCAGSADGMAVPLHPSEVPNQRVTRIYPAVNRCDPLVAQFFGHLEARPAVALEMER